MLGGKKPQFEICSKEFLEASEQIERKAAGKMCVFIDASRFHR